jgi:hypothetical protein
MDLAAARADGISFFTHKATESTNTQHIHYGAGMNRARAAGIPFLGSYHVVRTLSVTAQVDYHLAYVTAQTPWWSSFPGWFFQADLEVWPYDAVAPNYGVAFAAEIERRTGRRCLLYAPQWAYGNTVGGSAPLWASGYGANPTGPYRAAYPGDSSPRWGSYSGRVPVILQFGSQATIGRQPGCDINAFRGASADFAQLIRGEAGLGGGTPLTPGTPITPTPEDDMYDAAAESRLNTRLDAILAKVQHDDYADGLMLPAVAEMRGLVQGLSKRPAELTADQIAAAVKAIIVAPNNSVDVHALADALGPLLGVNVVKALAAKLGA